MFIRPNSLQIRGSVPWPSLPFPIMPKPSRNILVHGDVGIPFTTTQKGSSPKVESEPLIRVGVKLEPDIKLTRIPDCGNVPALIV